jgi:hypothetical protein
VTQRQYHHFKASKMALNQTLSHIVPVGTPGPPGAAFPPPRSPLDAAFPFLLYAPIMIRSRSLRFFNSKRPLPGDFNMSRTVLLVHIVLALAEAARFHLGSIRFNAGDLLGPLLGTDTPPLPGMLDLLLMLANVAFSVEVTRSGRRFRHQKIIRTGFQANSILRLVISIMAFNAARHGHVLLAAGSEANALVKLAWAARLHRASGRLLDIFAFNRLVIIGMAILRMEAGYQEIGAWGHYSGFLIGVYAADLPGLMYVYIGLLFAVNAVQDWVGRVIGER